MIYSFEVLAPDKFLLSHWGKVEALREKVSFQPGLNILWGRNGVGKSTLLRALALLTHCEANGRTCITEGSIHDIWTLNRPLDPGSFALRHDGQAVRKFDPNVAVGDRGSYFDEDFYMEGMQSRTFRGSSGERTAAFLGGLLKAIVEGEVPAIEWKIKKSAANSVWRERIEMIEGVLAANEALGPPTVLLDEPDRSLDFDMQSLLWKLLTEKSGKAQVIAATHSPFALGIESAHYIELTPGYLAVAKEVLANPRELGPQGSAGKPRA